MSNFKMKIITHVGRLYGEEEQIFFLNKKAIEEVIKLAYSLDVRREGRLR